jgi:hypothetical protein
MLKERGMGKNVAYMATEKMNIICWSKNLEGGEGFENAGVAGMITLKWTIKVRDSEFDPTG